jgi:nucleoside-diphosphate-sugar epimerase
MDLIPPLGVYAAMMREQGRALDYPGGAARVSQAVDADLLARAIGWAGEAEAARNEAFNVTNGDVFTWEGVWPAISDALEMKPGAAFRFRWWRTIHNGSRHGMYSGASMIWSRPRSSRP